MSVAERNLRLEPSNGESKPVKEYVKSVRPNPLHLDKLDENIRQIQPDELPDDFDPGQLPDSYVGRSFLTQPTSEGERFRAKVKQKIVEVASDQEKESPSNTKFLVSVDRPDIPDEVRAYGELLEIFSKQDEEDHEPDAAVWKFKDIVAHQGPIQKGHKDWKGSSYNVMVEWETGEKTNEPLNAIDRDDPVTCSIYAKRNGLLEKPGWKRFNNLA